MDNSELIPVDLTISAENAEPEKKEDKQNDPLEESSFSAAPKRRSKNVVEGRNHVCKLCTKAYLSYSALYTHIRAKHDSDQPDGFKPKKINDNPQKDSLRAFSTEEIVKSSESKGDVKEIVAEIGEEAFRKIEKEIYSSENNKLLPKSKKSPLVGLFLEYSKNKVEVEKKDACDRVFCAYLANLAEKTDTDEFLAYFKLVLLYRDALNHFYNQNYTSTEGAEDAPEIANEFMLEFLKSDSNSFGFSHERAKKMVMHLCAWMLEESFSCSKLFEYLDQDKANNM